MRSIIDIKITFAINSLLGGKDVVQHIEQFCLAGLITKFGHFYTGSFKSEIIDQMCPENAGVIIHH